MDLLFESDDTFRFGTEQKGRGGGGGGGRGRQSKELLGNLASARPDYN